MIDKYQAHPDRSWTIKVDQIYHPEPQYISWYYRIPMILGIIVVIALFFSQ